MKASIQLVIAWIAVSIVGSSAALAEEAVTEELVVAVPGLRALQGDDDAAHELTGWLRVGASGIDGWRLHNTVTSLEQLMLVTGCEAPTEACIAAIAKTLDADRVISGAFSRVDGADGYDFEAEFFFFDAQTGRIEKTATVRIERDKVRPGDLAVIGQQEVAKMAERPLDPLAQEQAAELAPTLASPDAAQLADVPAQEERFPIWPATVTYATGAAFIGLTAWSWVTLRNVEQDPSFDAARRLAGPSVDDVCSAGTNFGVEDLDSLCAKADTHEKLQWVFLGMSAASIGVGTWLLVKSLRSGKTSDQARLSVTPVAGRRGGGVSARLRF